MTTTISTPVTPVLYYKDDFDVFCELIQERQPVLIDEEMFQYWMEVLPPVYMSKPQKVIIDGVSYVRNCSFGFAEGRDYIVDFWPADMEQRTYWALQSNRLNTGY